MGRFTLRGIGKFISCFVLVASASAQVVNYTWVSAGDANYNNTANWQDGAVPLNDGLARLNFPTAGGTEQVTLPGGSTTLNALNFNVSYPGVYYQFSSAGPATLTIAPTAGSYGQTSNNSGYSRNLTFDASITIDIATDQYWTASSLTFNGAVGGAGRFRYLPLYYYSTYEWNTGNLTLNGPGNFAGGFETSNVNLYLNHADALDGGPLFLHDTQISAGPGYVLDNAITASGNFGGGGEDALTLTGPLTLNGGVNLSGLFNITGDIGETDPGASLGVYYGTIHLSGTNTYTGGTYIGGNEYYGPLPATLIFENPDSIPATGDISANSASYAGVTFTTGLQAGFIDRLSQEGFQGTIGFDSFGATQTFAENIDLGSLYSIVGLGSSTSAILTGTITTPGGGTYDYRFGNGGGTLTVASDLGLSVGLAVTNFGQLTPTTVILQGNNTFGGDGIWVSSGILIFDGANALPTGLNIFLSQSEISWDFAYAGITENAGLTPNDFLAQLDLQAPQAVLGLDSSDPNAPRTVSDNIDLAPGLEERDGLPYFIGTATGVTLTGTLMSGPAALGLTGLKGAELTVNSVFTDTDIASLTVGLNDVTGPMTGTVKLGGASTYTGGTLWQSGNLILGNSSALGTGQLTLEMNNDDSVLDYTGNLTLANDIRQNSYSVGLGNAGSTADLTLTGSITGYNYGGFEYLGGGTLTYAGTAPSMGWLTINAAPGGDVVYARPNSLSAGTILESGNLTITADTDIKYLETAVGTTTQLETGVTLGLLDNGYSEGPLYHEVAGTITGAGSVRLEGNGASFLGVNTYSGGTTLDGGDLGFVQAGALGTGTLTVTAAGGYLAALAQDLTLANTINLQGELRVYGSDYFGYNEYDTGANRDLTLSGVISGPGALYKASDNVLTLSGNNTFAGGIMIGEGSLVLAHDHAAGDGFIVFDNYYTEGTAIFTTAAPVIGGLRSDYGNSASVQLAANSTLTINQLWDSRYEGTITGGGAQIIKTGPGYLTIGGSQSYTPYTNGTTITGGGMIFDNDSLINGHANGGILVGAGGYAGLGGSVEGGWSGFFPKINVLSVGTIGLDGERDSIVPIDLSGMAPGLRLGSSSFGTLLAGAVITPNGDYRFGGGGGALQLMSTLTDFNRGLDLTSPADQPLTLLLRNNNYFGGPMTVTHSAAVFGTHSADFITNIAIGPGGYVGSADPQLMPADFLAKIAPGTNTGMVGFDDFNFGGRNVGGTVDLSAFGDGLFLGTASTATLRGPIVLPGGSTTYRFAAYKGGGLTVETNLSGANSVVIGDLASFGTMRDPHYPDTYSSVTLAGINTYTGGTVLNAGVLNAGARSLGTGAITVQANTFPATELPHHMLPRFEAFGLNPAIANNFTLNGSLWLSGGTQTLLSGVFSGAGGLYVDRYDYLPLTLTGANTYTGGTVIADGNLAIGHDTALGTGMVTMQPYGALITFGGDRTLANNFEVVATEYSSQPAFYVGGKYNLTLNGSIAFDPGTAYIRAASASFSTLPLLRLNGGLSGDTELHFNTGGMVWLAGTNTYTGGTQVDSGAVIFDSVAAMPALGQFTNYSSYIGLATPTASLQSAYIDRFSAGYGRVIGFDSPNPAAPNTFAANIDLGGMDHPYLSSATAAVLTGTITPSDNYYRFAATGGGVLTVASDLTGGRNVAVDYTYQPFLLRFTGTNTYTGNTVVNGAGLIFATAASLPTGSANLVANSSTGSYFGYEDPAISVPDFLSHFDLSLQHAVIGFDSVDINLPRTITSPDLSIFTSNEIYLGTATRAIIDGTITWPMYSNTYNFAAYRTGWLTVNAVIDGGGNLVIGNERQPWTLREVDGAYPTVELAGDNTFSGSTDFYGGQLVLSHANALGLGSVDVNDPYPSNDGIHRLVLNTPATLNNSLNLGGGDVNLRLATTQPTAIVASTIGGYGDLTKDGGNTIRLTGANSFTGHITIEQGTLEFAHATASGDVTNALRFAEAGGLAHFTIGNPILGRLESDDLASATVALDSGINLTVGNHDQGASYEYFDYYGSITGAGSLTKDGHATFTLHGASSYTGGTTITQGKLVADNATALGTGAITLNGGELALGQGVTVNNPISFGGAGGKLSGATTFTGAVVLGGGGGLSPGNSPGTMTFASDLTLGGSSFLDFEIQDPTGLAGSGYDTLVVSGTLFVTSTPATPFVINLLSLTGGDTSGPLSLTDPDATYSLLVVSAGLISGFAPENFTLNTAGFSTNFGDDFEFTLFQSGNELRLNFTAVPEPSTYALLGVGALLAGLARWRARGRT